EVPARQGELALGKRMQAGGEAMIAGLCESPLTLQAIIIWRDELNEGKIFLRDIIDLEATYAGPDAKNMQVPGVPGVPGAPGVPGVPGVPSAPPVAAAGSNVMPFPGVQPMPVAPPVAPVAPAPPKPAAAPR